MLGKGVNNTLNSLDIMPKWNDIRNSYIPPNLTEKPEAFPKMLGKVQSTFPSHWRYRRNIAYMNELYEMAVLR